MGIFDGFIKGFSKSSSKTTAQSVSRSSAATKAAGITTKTKIATQIGKPSVFKEQAKSVLGSKAVKTSATIGTSAVIIGGSAYAASALTGKGFQKVGTGWRGLTNNYTSQEQDAQDLANRSKALDLDNQEIDFLTRYNDFLKSQGLNDSPSSREYYDNYVLGDGKSAGATTEGETKNNTLLYVAGAAALIGGIILLSKKKKGGKN